MFERDFLAYLTLWLLASKEDLYAAFWQTLYPSQLERSGLSCFSRFGA